jgi:RNA polymerase sigma-B factor
VQSLNRPVFGPDDTTELGDTLGFDDRSIEAVADHDALRRALRALSPRLAAVVALRFLDELTQSEIGDKIGCSQMQVSRLLDRAMTVLRGHMTADLVH